MASQGMGKQGNRKAKLAFFTVSSVQEARKEEGMEQRERQRQRQRETDTESPRDKQTETNYSYSFC